MTINNSLTDITLNGWLLTPASNLVSFLTDEMLIAGLVEQAITTMAGFPTFLAVASQRISSDDTDAQANMLALYEQSLENAGLAEIEINSDFQRVRSHQAVAAWAAIETSIEHLLVNLVRRSPDAEALILANTPNAKIKFDRMKASVEGAKSAIQRWEPLIPYVETMERQTYMLNVLKVNVRIKSEISRTLSEMAGLRDVILHNAGIYDQRYKKRCPWRPESVGARVVIDRVSMSRYYDAATHFASALMHALVTSPYMRSTD